MRSPRSKPAGLLVLILAVARVPQRSVPAAGEHAGPDAEA
jgi:hypothetical protein